MNEEKKTELAPGLEACYEKEIPFEWTIASVDAKLPAVLSTPAMIAMMETAAALAVQPALPDGSITVGTRIEVDHLKAVPQGARVQAWARFTGTSGRFMEFDVEARHGSDVIGRGRVFRAVVDTSRFSDKTAKRVET